MADQPTARGRDRGLGYTLVLSLVTIGGAAVMLGNPASPVAGWGFAVAIGAATLAVIAAQWYG